MNIFIIFTIPLSCLLHRSHSFEVIQPQNRTVNPDGSVSISCEHTANVGSVEDVRLNAISETDRHKPTVLCQKGRKDCKNITMLQENPQKWLFIMLNIGPEAMTVKYQCEFTVNEDDIHKTRMGTPSELLPKAACLAQPSPSSRPPSPSLSLEIFWIAIGLLALMFLYSCVIPSFYIRLRVTMSLFVFLSLKRQKETTKTLKENLMNYCLQFGKHLDTNLNRMKGYNECSRIV
uniref:uncharacterized protein LOC120834510 isoform X2 n=1 Tax=Gasterosteus aculeatus aculeatus TaxID=481459 RepID=UPI001A97D921|nr:uncharacterized protein LOC120834510 isoform X2 [Gasterosteus aculeatus aculeatus]